MFRPIFAVLLAVATLSPAADKGGKIDWQTGTVVASKFDLRIDSNSAADARTGGAVMQTGHERIQLRGPDGTVYEAEQWVIPRKLIRALEGAELDFALQGKTVLVRMPDGSRRLKLIKKSDPPR